MGVITKSIVASSAYAVSGFAFSWAGARATSTAVQSSLMSVGLVYAFSYTNYRSYYKFLTSEIPAGVTITGATLTFTITADLSSTDFDVQIVKHDWSSLDPISNANRETAYDNCIDDTYAVDDNIWRNTSEIAINTPYTSGALNLTYVNNSITSYGAVYYSLRNGRDYSNSCGAANEYVTMYLPSDATVAYRPMLNLTYSVPVNRNPSINFTNLLGVA